MSGPATLASAKTPPIHPWYLPRSRGGTTSPMIACAPTMSPPAPMPWTARKPISSIMFWERPASIDPR